MSFSGEDSIYCKKMSKGESFKLGCRHFDNGEYFEAHEIWEELWLEARGSEHAFLQGLIQTAVALHHAKEENYRGTRKLFSTAIHYLERGRTAAEDFDIDRLINCILEFEIVLQKKLAGETVSLPFFKLVIG